MDNPWDEKRLQSHIDNFIEESLTLDYKAAQALEHTDRKKDQISKDVSAMANSAGGIVVYGLKEYSEPTKKHMAEKIDPIDRTQFSKESLEQIINNIRPHISGLIIHPIALRSAPNHVAYVVEIPPSNTAHQAADHRYYKRHNFFSEPMEDYEIRDTMNRATVPEATVEFSYLENIHNGNDHDYLLVVWIKNLGTTVINHLQLEFSFPHYDSNVTHIIEKLSHVRCQSQPNSQYVVRYRNDMVLFPGEDREVGCEMAWRYKINQKIHAQLEARKAVVKWRLSADNMPMKTGIIPFSKLNCF